MMYLHVTFCDIERCDTGVGDTASEGTTEHTFCVVGGIVGDGAKVPAQLFSQDALARRYAL